MSLPPAVASILLAAGTVSVGIAIVSERRMHRHRQPGVTYAQATFRGDGAWQREDLFKTEGLRLQRLAATFGGLGAGLWVLGLLGWALAWLLAG